MDKDDFYSVAVLLIFLSIVFGSLFYSWKVNIQPQEIERKEREEQRLADLEERNRLAKIDCTSSIPIVSLKTDNSFSISGESKSSMQGRGIFLLGIGYGSVSGSGEGKIDGKTEKVYYYYEDLGENRYKLGSIPTNGVIIHETNDKPALVTVKDCAGFEKERRFDVPFGTIVKEFNP